LNGRAILLNESLILLNGRVILLNGSSILMNGSFLQMNGSSIRKPRGEIGFVTGRSQKFRFVIARSQPVIARHDPLADTRRDCFVPRNGDGIWLLKQPRHID
jgi:hypothetical protein